MISPKPKVLVVDDQPAIRGFVAKLLSLGGYESVEAGDAAEALEASKRNVFALLIADVVLPGMSGIELVKALNAEGGVPYAILMSGDSHYENSVDTHGGRCSFLHKPFSPKELVAAVSALLPLDARELRKQA